MADGNKFDLGGVFNDVIKNVSDALNPAGQKSTGKKKTTKKKVTSIAGIPLPQSSTAKKTTSKKTSSKKTTSKSGSAANSAMSVGINAIKGVQTSKSPSKGRTATSKTTTRKSASGKTSTKATGKIMLEISGRQIDFKTIESKAAKLGGDCYVVVNEKKIYNDAGKSVSLF